MYLPRPGQPEYAADPRRPQGRSSSLSSGRSTSTPTAVHRQNAHGRNEAKQQKQPWIHTFTGVPNTDKEPTMSEHNHDHDHDRTAAPMVDEITDFEVLEIALRELCIEKGLFTAEDHRRFTEFAEHIGPTPCAPMVARAWLDPEFKKLVLADAIAASREGGV